MDNVLIIGASGHARAVVETIHSEAKCRVAGFIDSFQSVGVERFGYQVLGGEVDIPRILNAPEYRIDCLFIAIGDNYRRQAMYQRVTAHIPAGISLTTYIHPSAIIAPDVSIGEGTVIMPGAIVRSGSTVGCGCVVNTRASLDHDSKLADWSSLAPGVVTGGRVSVGERAFIGLGANIIHGVSIGKDTVVGAGSLVLTDIPEQVIAYGVPARPLRERKLEEAYL